jgi:hypothetical protein
MIVLMLAGIHNNSTLGKDSVISLAINNILEGQTLVVLTDSDELVQPNNARPNTQFLKVPSNTMGALATLAFGLSQIPENTPFVVVPSNSIIPTRALSKFEDEMTQTEASVGAVVFEGDSPLYSYARLDASGQIMEIVEKQVIGSCALTGVFFFKDKNLLSQCIKWAVVNNVHTKEKFFVAPALNYFIAHAIRVSLFRISTDQYVRL